MGRIIRGQNLTWEIQNLVGKGDAGEVYLVTASKPPLEAILKCPAKVATGGSIMRQASQIENEGRILRMLDGVGWKSKHYTLLTPRLLDESIPGTSQTAAYFFISQQANGDSLEELLRQVKRDGKSLSHRLLIKIIAGMFQLFELIHAKNILWNDVKPGHIFWDENGRTITVIDWGNGIILKDNGVKSSETGRFIEDIRQMLSEFGRILETTAPQLASDLGWPQGSLLELNDSDIDIVRKRVKFLENYYEHKVIESRALERLYLEKIGNIAELDQLITCQSELIQLGEDIDHQIVLNAAKTLILGSIKNGQPETCQMVLDRIKPLPWFGNTVDWSLFGTILSSSQKVANPDLHAIFELFFNSSWIELYWQLYRHRYFDQDNQARKGISYQLRQLIMPEACAIYHLRDMVKDLLDEHHIKLIQTRMKDPSAADSEMFNQVTNSLSDVVKFWNGNNTPGFLGDHLIVLKKMLPVLRQIGVAIDPCMETMIIAQSQLVRTMQFSWNAADFKNMRKTLHGLFVWDPDMPEVDRLDGKISSVDLWMKKLVSGPDDEIKGVKFIQVMLDQYTDLTQELGSPIWLQELLMGLSDLQKAEDADQAKEIIDSYRLPISWWDQ